MEELRKRLKELEQYKYNTVSGLNDGEKYFLPSLFNEKILIICNNLDSLNNYKLQLTALGKNVLSLEDCLPLVISLNETSSSTYKNYCKTLSCLATNNYDVLLVTPQALFQTLPQKQFMLNASLTFVKGKPYKHLEIISKLTSLGYTNTEFVTTVGEFSVRGDVIDIFPTGASNPIRLSFFDDELERINYFDETTFKLQEEQSSITIYCQNLFDKNSVDIKEIRNEVDKNFSTLKLDSQSLLRLTEIINTQFEYLENNVSKTSSVFFLPFCNYFNCSLFNYLQADTKIIIDEPKLITDKLTEIEESNISNFLDLSLKGEFLPKSINFYQKKTDILQNIKNFNLIAYSRLISQNKIFNSEYCLNFICYQNLKYQNHFVELTQTCKNLKRNHHTILLSAVLPLTINKIKTFFQDENLDYVEISSIEELKQNQINITTQNIPFSTNFEMEHFVLVGSNALNNHQALEKQFVKTEEVKPKFSAKVGDYVVHQVHGVGKYQGIQNLKLTNVYRDYIIIEYRDGDILYLPPENADMLSNFVGEANPKCNKIGGTEFFKVKQKVKNSIKEMAFDLKQVYSQRLNSKGFKYSKDTYLQTEFENAFPYNYTQDQITAINEIKKDMESGKIMDRLLCGDVGFGKTEVALVAAFKAIQDGKQVAIICPTTILCEQHYNTALGRLKNFMVEIEAINRFKTKKEQTEILQKLADGKVDLICGTHRLFSKDVKFKDLGLIILDEEQRFGVEDKERLKNLKKTVDVLSLSATPIPRTLYMSLVGIRDVSFLSTPPKERKPIHTMVVDYSNSILVSACKKELERGGQVLIVYNRVESILNFYAKVKELLPDVNIGVAHGQMSPKQLEDAIYNLYSRKTQILISTILIENGIDLPYANTLFVIDADKLGLSQLYQLRGRIGRSNIEAEAYFSFASNKTLTEEAYKRLDAIMEFSDFGSGYKVALRDLEIRGAGDVLGKMQHGHIEQVGYDMYIKLLNEVVSEIKGEKITELKEIKVDISLNAYLPETYIKGNEQRIAFYTKVSKTQNLNDFNNLIEETRTTYGELPKSVMQLCIVGLIKNTAQQLGVKRVVLNNFECKIMFYSEILQTPFFQELSKPSTQYVLSCENMPIIKLPNKENMEKTQESLINFLHKFTQIKNK